MKKIIRLVIPLVIAFILLTSCIGDNKSPVDFSFDSSGSYTGFNNLPHAYTSEFAKNDGFVISSPIGIAANQKVWDKFIKTSRRGVDSSVRLVYFGTEPDVTYYSDLFYNNGAYYHFDSTSESLIKQPYKYLLILDGKFGSPLRDSTVIILTDDDSLTFDVIMKTMLSSSMDYINSISDFQYIMFQ